MGTHPIFESDFDCLTDVESRVAKMAEGSMPPTNYPLPTSYKGHFVVASKYRLVRKIGSGSFGDIYLGIKIVQNLTRRHRYSTYTMVRNRTRLQCSGYGSFGTIIGRSFQFLWAPIHYEDGSDAC